MDLNRAGRDLYTLELAAADSAGDPVTPTGYDASFDGGITWVPGHLNTDTGWWEWLVAGPLVDNTADPFTGYVLAATITDWTTQPIVRCIDNPKILADDAPPITLAA